MTLTRFDRDGLELVINTQTGEAYASVRGYARMSGKAQSTVQSRIDRMSEGERITILKTAEIETTGGVQGVRLIPADLVFEWLVKDNKDLALTMGKVGATVYLHQLAGFKVTSDAIIQTPKLPQTYREALRALLAAEDEKALLEAQISQMGEEIERQAEVIDELFDYSSIIRISKFNQVSEKSFNWRTLKAASKVLNLEVKHAPCPRYGVKNLYHHEAWKRAYPQFKVPENYNSAIVRC